MIFSSNNAKIKPAIINEEGLMVGDLTNAYAIPYPQIKFKWMKINQFVTLTWDNALKQPDFFLEIRMMDPIPAEIRPIQEVFVPIMVLDGGGYTAGTIRIFTNGTMYFYSGLGGGTFSNLGVGGPVKGGITYSVDV